MDSDFSLLPGQPTAFLSAAMATEAVWKLKALLPENEEEEKAGALEGSGLSYLSPTSLHDFPDRQVITAHRVLSLYPLRC